jgi:hypothetical protein
MVRGLDGLLLKFLFPFLESFLINLRLALLSITRFTSDAKQQALT